MPGAHVSPATHGATERRPMRAGARNWVFLHSCLDPRRTAEPGFSPEIAAGWVLRQFTKHAWHCHCNRKPLVDFPQAVDPHTNQKDYEVAFDLRRHSLRDYGGHSNLRLWGSVHGSISPSRP